MLANLLKLYNKENEHGAVIDMYELRIIKMLVFQSLVSENNYKRIIREGNLP